ncbi:MAG: hypothetical protein IT228_02110 [Flavobacteriales bacterium]|nr:hypothetical protein [Flavobacteriales bacterium]MCC6576110.1 hypothetical protein [Flavobacteriales bacterium]
MRFRRPLLLSALLLLAAVAAVALLRGDAVKQDLRALRDRFRQPNGPTTAAMPHSPARPDTHNAGTLATDDPPPFDRPRADRSAPAITVNGRTLRPNLHFDMESSADSSLLVRGIAHGGERSMLLKAAAEYGPAIRRRAGDVGAPLTAVAAGLWCRSDDPGLVIVTTIHRGEEQRAWYGKELRAGEHAPGVWQRLQGELLLRDLDVADEDVITVYLWNKHHHDTWIDDMDVVFRSAEVLGRDSLRPHDLEDSTRTTRPLPFARVECLGAVDPAQVGIRSGAPPPAGTEAIALPGGALRWHYTPGDGVARLLDGTGRARCLVRPWCPGLGDLLGFERVHVTTGAEGLRLVGYDVDRTQDGTLRVAAAPAPKGALVRMTLP